MNVLLEAKMCNCFKNIKAGYQITDMIENIDLIRILRENKNSGCNYVFILTEKDYVAFFTKKMSNRLKKLDIFNVINVEDDYNFGIVKIEEGFGVMSSIAGNIVRSIGYTSFIGNTICNYSKIMDVVRNIDIIEDYLESEKFAKLSKMNVVKVISG
jgi:hypothetical protein